LDLKELVIILLNDLYAVSRSADVDNSSSVRVRGNVDVGKFSLDNETRQHREQEILQIVTNLKYTPRAFFLAYFSKSGVSFFLFRKSANYPPLRNKSPISCHMRQQPLWCPRAKNGLCTT